MMSETGAIRVILVDDHQHIHDAINALLKTAGDIHLVGQAYRGEDALDLCRITRADLVLMDVVLPGMSGCEATRALRKHFPYLHILALSSFREYEIIKTMIDSGATGYLVKDAIAADLIDTIRATHQGYTVLSPEAAQAMFSPPEQVSDFGLTDRERQVLTLLAQGQTNDRIADALGITAPTVRFHLGNILAKLNVGTRSEALVLAAKHNLVP